MNIVRELRDARYWIYYHPEQILKILCRSHPMRYIIGLWIIGYFILAILLSPIIFIFGGVEAVYNGVRAKRLPFNLLFGRHCDSC